MSFVVADLVRQKATVASPIDKCVLMCLAGHAHNDGTGAHPSAETLAKEACCSERTVRAALHRLTTAEVIECERRNGHGLRVWSINLQKLDDDSRPEAASTLKVQTGSSFHSRPEAASDESVLESKACASLSEKELSSQNEEPQTSGVGPTSAPPHSQNGNGDGELFSGEEFEVLVGEVVEEEPPWPKEVAGKKVKTEEGTKAVAVLAAWNELAGQRLTAKGHFVRIIMRLREHPEVSVEEHRACIERNLAAPWWAGAPGPEVVYGKDSTFERALMCDGVRRLRSAKQESYQAGFAYARAMREGRV